MNCSSFERWLDAGMPEAGSRHALVHASGCRVCAPALAEARAVEAALRAEAESAGVERAGVERAGASVGATAASAAASTGFVDAVMARVEAEGAHARPVDGAVRRMEGAPASWWLRLFADPVSVVSVTLAFVVGSLSVLKPEWVTAGASAILAFGQRAGEGLAAWPVLNRPSPAAFALAVAIAPVVALAAVAVYRSFERALILVAGARRR